MLDMRYHIVSLAAVFLALALGILLGPLIVEKGVLVEQQEKLISEIRKDIKELKEKNRELQKEVSQTKHFEEQVLPTLVKDELKGKKVMVLTTSPASPNLYEKVARVLIQSGAETNLVNPLFSQWGLSEVDIRKKIKTLPFLEGSGDKELEEKITERFALEVTAKTNQELLKTLWDLRVVNGGEGEKVEELHLPAEGIVILKSDNEKNFLSLNQIRILIQKFKKSKITVVGVETSQADPSYMNFYQEAGIPTVDNIDTIPGLVSLVFALRGEIGNFGVKPTADRLTPLK